MKLSVAYHQFITYLTTQKRSSVHTVSAYARDCSLFLLYCSNHNFKTTKSLDAVPFTSYLVFLKRDRKLSNRSIARNVAAVRSFMRFLADRNIAQVPLTYLSAPKQSFPIPKILGRDKLTNLFAELSTQTSPKQIRDNTMLWLLYASGMRVSELTGLSLDAIDWQERVVRVFGKGSKERLIPLPTELIVLLDHYVTIVRPHLALKMSHNSPLLFFASRQYVWYTIKKLGATCSLNLYPHLLRHSFATHFLANGADLRSLQTILGHRNLTTTQIYTHVDKHQLRLVYDKVHLRK